MFSWSKRIASLIVYFSTRRHFVVACKILLAMFGLSGTGCLSESTNEVVVYVALDKEFSEPLLKKFETQTGIRVRAKYDVESNKTVGLANELLQSDQRSRADVFWNNEVLHTFRLQNAGMLASYHSKFDDQYPEQFHSTDGYWHGFAARARVIIVNTNIIPNSADRPDSIRDLANPKWNANCGIAKPFFGTTATHAAVLFGIWAEEDAFEFFRMVAKNCVIEGGNKQVAKSVAGGKYAWGITDTDDAIIELDAGGPVAIILPDQQSDELGCLLIPNTLSILKNAENPVQAQQLIDFLLDPATEQLLVKSSSAQIALAKDATDQSRAVPVQFKPMEVDFAEAAKAWQTSSEQLLRVFQ